MEVKVEETYGAPAQAKSAEEIESAATAAIQSRLSQADGKGQGQGPERFGVSEAVRRGVTP